MQLVKSTFCWKLYHIGRELQAFSASIVKRSMGVICCESLSADSETLYWISRDTEMPGTAVACCRFEDLCIFVHSEKHGQATVESI